MSNQIIYILTNQAMPGFIKIGKTEGDLLARIRGLSTTSVPFEFECFYAAEVADCHVAEKLIHDGFADHRANPRREFFKLDPERARSVLKLAEVKEVTPGIDDVIPDPAERSAVQNMATKRRNTSLKDLGILPGSKLVLDRDQNVICDVVDDYKVLYNGEPMSLSASALIALQGLGYEWTSVNGWSYWTHEGRKLTEMVDEFLEK